jgi:hypothetical protein
MSDDAVITNQTHGGFVNQDVTATIHNLTIDQGAELVIPDGIKLQIDGDSITVNGQLKLNSTGGNFTVLYIGGSTVTLSGSGWVTMSDSGLNAIYGGSGNLLINQLSSTQGIQGAGEIAGFSLNLQNFGTINANAQKGLLVQLGGKMPNAGVLEGTTGHLVLAGLNSADIVNTSSASIQGSVRLFRVTISGGTLGPGLIVAGRSGPNRASTLDGVTLAIGCQYQVAPGGITNLKGTITNEGAISLIGTQDAPAKLTVEETSTLTGGGSTTINGPNDSIGGSGFLIND